MNFNTKYILKDHISSETKEVTFPSVRKKSSKHFLPNYAYFSTLPILDHTALIYWHLIKCHIAVYGTACEPDCNTEPVHKLPVSSCVYPTLRFTVNTDGMWSNVLAVQAPIHTIHPLMSSFSGLSKLYCPFCILFLFFFFHSTPIIVRVSIRRRFLKWRSIQMTMLWIQINVVLRY